MILGCTSRFTHANRHCPEHQTSALKRQPVEELTPTPEPTETNPAILDWFDRQAKLRQDRTPQRFRPRMIKRSLQLQQDIENQNVNPTSSARKRLASVSEDATAEPDTKKSAADDTYGFAGVRCLDGSPVPISTRVLTARQPQALQSHIKAGLSSAIPVPTINALSLPVPEKSWVGEQRDRILGALALVQLAQSN